MLPVSLLAPETVSALRCVLRVLGEAGLLLGVTVIPFHLFLTGVQLVLVNGVDRLLFPEILFRRSVEAGDILRVRPLIIIILFSVIAGFKLSLLVTKRLTKEMLRMVVTLFLGSALQLPVL